MLFPSIFPGVRTTRLSFINDLTPLVVRCRIARATASFGTIRTSPPFPATCYHTMNHRCEDSATRSGLKYWTTRPGCMQRKSRSVHFPERAKILGCRGIRVSADRYLVLLLALTYGATGCGSPARSTQRSARIFEGQTVRVA